MGRKIPAKRHHGVKDPLRQHARRLQSLKSKINAPPTDPDEQPVPKSLTRLFEFKEQQEQKKKNKTKTPVRHYEDEEESGNGNPVASLKRLPGESSRSFNQRINNAVQSINKRHLQTQEMEKSLDPDHYLPDDESKEERYEYIQRKKQQRKMKAQKMNADGAEESQKMTRMQRWTLKKKEKKAKLVEEKEDDFEPKYETVKFGEIAHEPPSLHIKPRKAQTADGAPRPGRKDLLLNKLLGGGKQETEQKKVDPRITVNTKPLGFDKKAKRKSLPIGVRMRLEQSQKEAIEAYRAIKANSIKNKS